MEKIKITDGIHKLTATGYSYDYGDSYVFVIDGIAYCLFEDDVDEYRSEVGIKIIEKGQFACYPIPETEVKIESDFELGLDSYLIMRNPKDDSIIFSADNAGDYYYPVASLSYSPQNLPINQ